MLYIIYASFINSDVSITFSCLVGFGNGLELLLCTWLLVHILRIQNSSNSKRAAAFIFYMNGMMFCPSWQFSHVISTLCQHQQMVPIESRDDTAEPACGRLSSSPAPRRCDWLPKSDSSLHPGYCWSKHPKMTWYELVRLVKHPMFVASYEIPHLKTTNPIFCIHNSPHIRVLSSLHPPLGAPLHARAAWWPAPPGHVQPGRLGRPRPSTPQTPDPSAGSLQGLAG